MRRILALAVCLCCVFAGSAPAQTAGLIQKLDDAWSEAYNKGDAAALARMYTPDAYVLPEGHDIVRGRATTEGFWKGAMQQLGNAKLVVINVLPLGPRAAREIGTFSFETKTQPSHPVIGKYVVVWRRIGGRWLLATDIWNTNK